MEDKEKWAACALNRVFGYEPRIALRLVAELGSAAAVFALGERRRNELTGPYSKYAGSLTDALLEDCRRELESLEKKGCGFIPFTSAAYPALLKECEDPPAGLYFRSVSPPEEVFSKRPFISVVGTRDMSPYGKEWCEGIVEAMSQAPEKPCIVSGLAFGVDITAHRTALDCGLPTIAVLPNGIDEVYPKAHRKEAALIAASPGSALVSDYPPGTGPVAFTFLRRNRIIAALSRATVLIESKIRGGGLITARLASAYGREVYALPGRADDIRSAGCNMLIKEKIADAVVNLSEVGEQLGLGRYRLRRRADFLARAEDFYRKLPLERRERLLETAATVHSQRGITLNGLCGSLGRAYPEVSALARKLESDGFICIDLLQRCTINTKNV